MIEKAQFHLHDDHLKLLGASSIGWSWCEFGAVEFNPKYPYGDSSVTDDIMKLLGFDLKNVANISYHEDGDIDYYEFIEEYETYFRRVHRQTEYAIRVVLSAAPRKEIPEPGIYEAGGEGGIFFPRADWNFIRPASESDPVGFLSYADMGRGFRSRYHNERQYDCGVCGRLRENLSNPIDRRADIRCVCGTLTRGGSWHVFIPPLRRPVANTE